MFALDPTTLQAVRDEWRAMEEIPSPFATYEWVATWCEHLLEGDPLVVACRRTDGALAAVLALEVRRERGLRVARWLGHGPADELGPVCGRADRAATVRALRALRGLDVLHATLMNPEWERLLGGVRVEREASPLIDFAGFESWEAWLASRSSNFRSQVRSRERKLEHEARLALVASHDPADIEHVIALHEARWEGASQAFAGARAGFHRAFAASAAERGWLRLWRAELSGRTAAAWYGLRFAGEEWYYQSGRDPGAPGSIGFVLLGATIRAALQDGCRRYRLGLGNESYKERFADRDPGLVSLVVPVSLPGRMAVGAYRLRRAARG